MKKIKRFNPTEIYDKETQWEEVILYVNFAPILFKNFLNNILWNFNAENREFLFSFLDSYENKNGSFRILEVHRKLKINDEKTKILNQFDLAIAHKYEKFYFYSKIISKKNWKLERNVTPINTRSMEYQLTNAIFQIISEYFPNFYEPGYFQDFEQIQETDRLNYETYLQNRRKKNPKKRNFKILRKS